MTECPMHDVGVTTVCTCDGYEIARENIRLVKELQAEKGDLEEKVEVISNAFLFLEDHMSRWGKFGSNQRHEVSMSGCCHTCGLPSPCPAEVWRDMRTWRKHVRELPEREAK